MCRNEGLYPDPETFNPDRFMEEVDDETRRKRDPRNFVFGFGRRLVGVWLTAMNPEMAHLGRQAMPREQTRRFFAMAPDFKHACNSRYPQAR